MNVKLRQRLSKKTNRISLYIELYKGYDKDDFGKIKLKRSAEYLEYFLYGSPKTPSERQHNKDNLKGAEAVLAKRRLEIQNNQYGFATESKGNTLVKDYFAALTQQRKKSPGNYGNWDSALKHFESYCNNDTSFREVDVKFVEGFKEYLQEKAKMKTGKLLSTNSALSYFNKFRAVINDAYEEGLLTTNPLKRVKSIKQASTHRDYLTWEEVDKLAHQDCRYPVLKNAFLFSCLTGLRWSDIQKLIWKEIHGSGEDLRIIFTQKKTKGAEYLNIPSQAEKCIGARGKDLDKVFVGLKYGSYTNVALTQWMLKAGITKPITFHCARHTFATAHLTAGTDIYTVSKLLGHSELKTTQIYAKIIDQKKREAANRLPDLML